MREKGLTGAPFIGKLLLNHPGPRYYFNPNRQGLGGAGRFRASRNIAQTFWLNSACQFSTIPSIQQSTFTQDARWNDVVTRIGEPSVLEGDKFPEGFPIWDRLFDN